MGKVMLQFKQEGKPPTVAEAAEIFDLAPEEVDGLFGVVLTDPDEGLYTILIADAAQKRAQARLDERSPHPGEGIFSNPRVDATGPES